MTLISHFKYLHNFKQIVSLSLKGSWRDFSLNGCSTTRGRKTRMNMCFFKPNVGCHLKMIEQILQLLHSESSVIISIIAQTIMYGFISHIYCRIVSKQKFEHMFIRRWALGTAHRKLSSYASAIRIDVCIIADL